MSKGVYLGVDGYARKVKSMYIGVDGVARKIKKAYLGVEGYARLFYSSGGIKKVTSSISDVRGTHSGGASASNGSYAMFAGGGNYFYVDAYNDSLTLSRPSNLANKANLLCGCGFHGYGVFAGGSSSMGEYFKTVEAYGSTLSKQTLSSMSHARMGAAMAATTNYLVILGGYVGSGSATLGETYTANLTKGNSIPDSTGKFLCGVSFGGRACFCGGLKANNETSGWFGYFDDNLIAKSCDGITPRCSLAGATVGNYALFGGGDSGSESSVLSTVEAYNSDMTRVMATNLPNAVRELSGVSIGNYALLGGGRSIISDSTKTYADVAAYDENLTRTLFSLSSPRYGHVSASVGNYALFAGGAIISGSTQSNTKTVEAFQYGG